jgi:hypothetical protein
MRPPLLICVLALLASACDKPKPPSPDAGTTPVAPGPDASVPVTTGEPDVRALAAREPILARMLQTRDELDAELSRLRTTSGPNAAVISKLEADRRALDERIGVLVAAMTRAATTGPAER